MSAAREPPVEAVVMGCSAGGVEALRIVLGRLRHDFDVPLIVVCHTEAGGSELLVELLKPLSRLPVEEARERAQPRRGVVHIAPAGYHLLMESQRHFALSVDPPVNYSRPSIDVLFESAADVWGAGLAAVLLTGANEDGARGLRSVRSQGGFAIVQQPYDAYAPDMPEAGLRTAGADRVCRLEFMADAINDLRP